MELKNKKVTRQLQADVQQQNSQVVFSFASEVPYLRTDQFGSYYEILKCQPQYVDTTRLEDGACQLLLDHDWQRSIGVCKKHWFANKKLYASIKFSRSNFAQGIKRDVLDEIRRNVSIGYIVKDYKVVDAINGIKTIEVTDWQPYELTICSVPADPTVGFQRSLEESNTEELDGKDTQMKNAKTDKTIADVELAKQDLETKKTDVDLENKDLAGEDLESKSEEATEGKEEKEKELCPECNKPLEQCECEKDCGKEEKECSGEVEPEQKECGEMKPEEKALEITKEPTVEELRAALIKSLETDAKEIRELGEIVGDRESAERFVAEHRSLDQFKTYLKTKDSDKSKNSIQDTKKMEKKYFSIVHAINNIRNHNVDPEDYENKVTSENKRNLNITENADIFITNNELYFKRAFNDGTTMTGGSQLIHQDYLPQEFVPFDRPQLTIDKVGGYSIPSNGQPICFTQCTSGATADMYTINGELSAGDMDFVLKQMVPHKCGCYIPIPYDLLLEGRPDIDSLVQADIVNALYQKRDEQIWTGDGTGNNVAGIESLTGINQITGVSLSAGDAWGGMLSGVGAIRKANIFNENISYVMNTDTYITLKKTMKDTNNCFAGFIIEDDKIGNYPVYVNNAVSANTVLVGVGSDIAVTDFRGLGMIVDPYTYSTKQSLRVTAWISFDMVLRREKAWSKIELVP